ncbi:ParB/RepB/Spo0J family partition protein [Streptomyces pseudovenezuelae]|uniref:DNA-binding Lrp family transcriptional regulator n=1 Tax=Streptomyces pseudovenezuelae TaxID=67350 RepID=A0ABT6M203_9ACTN|nr:ParB N-terminal domain-containing protein [Streptomyces pseudovenezuelae]MDH6222579.1 DNA-binding Lrp family transcriptional regulator [Streptomyces pseudovenezuelae]
MQLGQAQFEQGVIVDVDIDSLVVEGSPRSTGEDQDHIQALVEVWAPLPPVLVHRQTMRVIDGVHRLRAAQLRGDDKIAVTYFDGTESDAFVLSVESNITHGLPLSMADRKRAASRIITTHPQWSDRMIASATGLSPGTVSEIRRQAAGDTLLEGSRIGQDGRVRPVNSAVGRELAGKLIRENPGLSLRQIARAARISPETARDVRNRIHQGEDPLPKPRVRARPRPRTPAEETSRDRIAAAEQAISTARIAARVAAVDRLKSDPALRFSETGRTLLRLLNIHTLTGAEWQAIIDSVPPHCTSIVADLAHEFAGVWGEIAARIEHQTVEYG